MAVRGKSCLFDQAAHSHLLQTRPIRSIAIDACSPERGKLHGLIIALAALPGILLAAEDHTAAQTLDASPSTQAMPNGNHAGAWDRANLAFGGWCLLTIVLLLGFHRWRSIRQQQQTAAGESNQRGLQLTQVIHPNHDFIEGSAESLRPGSRSNSSRTQEKIADGGLDLQLLRFLSDGTAEGFVLQIDIYLKAFDADRQVAHVIFAKGDGKQIHRIAHRLVAHAGAVNFVPLVDLATTIQSAAAILTRKQLDQMVQEIDREFANLTNILDRLRASTARA